MSDLTDLLDIHAGPAALSSLQSNGLNPDHISAVFGASGAAKWLAIYGLDRVILGDWLNHSAAPTHLFGTSVGAFKLAAACHLEPHKGLDRLADLYIEQSYEDGFSREIVAREVTKLLDAVISPELGRQILAHPRYRYSCGAARCLGMLGSENLWVQNVGMTQLAAASLAGRKPLRHFMNRVVFHDDRSTPPVVANDGIATFSVPLSEANLRKAVLASGSLPAYMHGVEDIEGAPKGTYRDGGLLDYHPVPGQFWAGDGLILYPHFYPRCKAGWFDKFWPNRVATGDDMNTVVLISPSKKFFEQTQLGRVPDRRDFGQFKGRDEKRMSLWREVADASHQLGEAFLELVNSGDIAAVAKPL